MRGVKRRVAVFWTASDFVSEFWPAVPALGGRQLHPELKVEAVAQHRAFAQLVASGYRPVCNESTRCTRGFEHSAVGGNLVRKAHSSDRSRCTTGTLSRSPSATARLVFPLPGPPITYMRIAATFRDFVAFSHASSRIDSVDR